MVTLNLIIFLFAFGDSFPFLIIVFIFSDLKNIFFLVRSNLFFSDLIIENNGDWGISFLLDSTLFVEEKILNIFFLFIEYC